MRKTYYPTFAILAAIITSLPQAAYAESKAAAISKLISKRNLLAVPSTSTLVSKYTKSGSAKSSRLNLHAAAPPNLSSIPGKSIKELFWRSIDGVNVIDAINSGNPSPEHCAEFFSGDKAGQSGGLGACFLAESVGYSFSTIIDGGSALCHMRNFPTKRNFAAGGITVVSGQLPNGDIQKLLAPPSGSTPRIVKVRVSGEDGEGQGGAGEGPGAPEVIYIQVASQDTNKSAGNTYHADLWFCDSDGTSVLGYDRINISKSQVFTSEHGSDDDFGKNISTTQGYLVPKGNKLSWDSSRSRTSTTRFESSQGDQFMSEIEITKANQIQLKRMDSFGGNSGKGYMITKYLGSKAQDLKFTSGAFMDQHKDNTFTKATTYTDPFYSTITSSPLLGEVSAVDLNSGFYLTSLDFEVDLSPFSCSVTADIEVIIDMSNETVRASIGECASERLEGMHFCHDDPLVAQADAKYLDVCAPPPGPPPGP